MKKSLLLLVMLSMLFALTDTAYGQRWKTLRYEAMVGIGSTNIFGDIGGSAVRQNWWGLRDLDFGSTRPSFWLGMRYKFRQDMGIRLNFIYGFGAGSDKGSINEGRDIKYTSQLFEQSVIYEYYFIPEEKRIKTAAIYNRKGMLNNYSNIGVYAFAGFGGVLSIPNVKDLNGGTPSEFLRPSGYHIIFPLGLGAKYVVDERWLLGAELGVRLSLSDAIDGYDPQVDANKANDLYYFGSINVSYRLKTDRRGYPTFINRLLNR
jgi:OmpA-OmpF porin, OOP family